MKTYIVIGAGGTGSYLINNIINYTGSLTKEKSRIVLVDGDTLEDRNLLRQGFLKMDVGKNKAQALYERFNKVIPGNLTIEYKDTYINNIDEIMDICKEDQASEYIMISCVDNNIARYRMVMAQFKIFEETGKTVVFIDGGNTEWQGQAIANVLREGNKAPVSFNSSEVTYTGEIEGHIFSTIFDQWGNWKSKLTRGDHELSCEVVTEASPQNIAANMSSANGIMYQLHSILQKEYKGMRYQFNASTGVQETIQTSPNLNRLKELVDYANKEGGIELFRSVQEKEEDEEFKQSLFETIGTLGEDEDRSIEQEGFILEDDELFQEVITSLDNSFIWSQIQGATSIENLEVTLEFYGLDTKNIDTKYLYSLQEDDGGEDDWL